ncbi:MAG: HlyD family secretion protein [Campylobacterales bacterium]|nr:HlyD family secretion protein [Campylobacterales bacterium]
MKIFLSLFFLSSTLLFSKVYYSKVEPYELRTISANIAGLVEYVDEESLGKKLDTTPYVIIDSELDRDELAYTKEKIANLKETLELNTQMLQNLQDSLIKKRENYKRVEVLKIKSQIEKDKEFHDLITSENTYIGTQKEIVSLKTQIADLELRKAQLIRSIKDKTLTAKGFVLYSLAVREGQVVTMATPLAKVADVSKGLLTIYLDEEDVEEAQEKTVYINGEKTNYKISRLLRIADSTNISKYMAQIVIASPKVFSKLVKIELKGAEGEK